MIEIKCYVSEQCTAEEHLRSHIAEAVSLENIEAQVKINRIDADQAGELGLSGSPAIFINGKELQPQTAAGFI